MKTVKFGVIATLAMTVLGHNARAQEYTMKISVPSPSGGYICDTLIRSWADRIIEKTDGRIKPELFCDSTLSRVGDTVTRVASGVADAGWDLPNVYGSRFAPYAVAGLPGIVTDAGVAAKTMSEMDSEGIFPKIEDIKVASFQVQNSLAIWTRDPLSDMTNLDGRKIISGSAQRGELTAQMGGVPLSLRVPEYYQALVKGAGDGLMTNLGSMMVYKFYEITPHGYRAPWGTGISFYFVSETWFNALPEDLQVAVASTMGGDVSAQDSLAFDAFEQAELQAVIDAGHAKITTLSDADVAKLLPAFEAVAASWAKSTENGQAYIDEFKKRYNALSN
jgi:TRAP-type C4-dicarboxylate transport system substrate-binding protein